MVNKRGIFLGEDDFPPHVLKKFAGLCKLSGKDPREYIKDLILKDLQDFEERQKPILDRIVEKGVQAVKNEYFKLIG